MNILNIFKKKKNIIVGDDCYIIDDKGNKIEGKIIAIDKGEVLFNDKWIKIKIIHKDD